MSRSMRPLSRRLLSLQCRRCLSNSPSDRPTDSREEVRAILQEEDDVYLAKVKRRVEGIEQQARKIGSMVEQYGDCAGKIQVDPQIPVYRVDHWKKQSRTSEALVRKMLQQTARVRLNLIDLETIPYPSDDEDLASDGAGVATLAKLHRDKMLLQTREEKEKALWDLSNEQAAHSRRLEASLESFEQAVEDYKLESTRTPVPQQFGREGMFLEQSANPGLTATRQRDRNRGGRVEERKLQRLRQLSRRRAMHFRTEKRPPRALALALLVQKTQSSLPTRVARTGEKMGATSKDHIEPGNFFNTA